MLVLSGIALLAAGFMLRFNPLLVVLVAALATGLAAGLAPLAILAAFGKAFNDSRYVTIIYMMLPLIGLLERHGLQERARMLITGMRGATAGRLLIAYMIFRQVTAACGLNAVAGQAQTVRPLLAPMAEAAAQAQSGEEDRNEQVAAMAAATDNIGNFFGEDIFLAMGSVLLMKGVLETQGIEIAPLDLSVWAIPTAIAATLIHGLRMWRLDRRLTARGRR